MMVAIPTLHCGGRCADAIELYKKAFGLVVDWQGKDEQTHLIYHTEAHIGEQRIRLSDGGERDVIQADSLFLAVVYDSAADVERAFDILKDGGTVIQAPHKPAFAAYMCEIIDRFGFKWYLMVD